MFRRVLEIRQDEIGTWSSWEDFFADKPVVWVPRLLCRDVLEAGSFRVRFQVGKEAEQGAQLTATLPVCLPRWT